MFIGNDLFWKSCTVHQFDLPFSSIKQAMSCRCVGDAAETIKSFGFAMDRLIKADTAPTRTGKWRVNQDPLPSTYVFGYCTVIFTWFWWSLKLSLFTPLSSLSWDSWPPERRPEFDLDLQSFATQPRKCCTWIGLWMAMKWMRLYLMSSESDPFKATSNPSHKAVGQVLCRHIRQLNQWPQGGYRGHAPQRISCS